MDVRTVLGVCPERKEARRAVESWCMVMHMHLHTVLGYLLWSMLPKMENVAGICPKMPDASVMRFGTPTGALARSSNSMAGSLDRIGAG